MNRVLRGVAGTLVGVPLVMIALLVAYAFGAGYGGSIFLPTPLNVVGSLAVVWAAVHATYVLAVPRDHRQPFTRASRAMTTLGVLITVAIVVVALVYR